MSSNMFYETETLVNFTNDVKNGEADINDEADFVANNYPKNRDDIDLKYDAEEGKTTASYKGQDLFTVDGDTVYDIETGVETRADAGLYRQFYGKELGEEGIQANVAKDYVDFKQDFAQAYTKANNDLIDMGDKLDNMTEAFEAGYSDVSIENTQGCYVTATVGDNEETFAIYSPDDSNFDSLVEFVKENAQQKEIEPNSLNAEQAILLADMRELKGEDRAEFLLNTLNEKAFKADDPYYQPVLDGVKAQLEGGMDPEETGVPMEFYDDRAEVGLGDGIYNHTECSREELLTSKGMDEMKETRQAVIKEDKQVEEEPARRMR